MTWLWITTLGSPGIAPVMMSSRLGLVAEVMATESPSHDRPTVIHSTCAVTASVAAWFGTNSVADIAVPLSSTDPRERVADQLVHDPSPAEGRLHQHHPGRVRADLAHHRGLRAHGAIPGAAQRAQLAVGRLGGDLRHEHALVGDVHRVD